MLYSGLMIKHLSTGKDVENKGEREAVRLIAATYILGLDSSLCQKFFDLYK